MQTVNSALAASQIPVFQFTKFRNFPEPPTPGIFSKVSPVQMGGVLRYKWKAYCSTNWRCIAAFTCLQSFEAREAQRYKWGAHCGTNWRCTASTFQTSCTCWGLLNSLQRRLELSISKKHLHRRWGQGSGQC